MNLNRVLIDGWQQEDPILEIRQIYFVIEYVLCAKKVEVLYYPASIIVLFAASACLILLEDLFSYGLWPFPPFLLSSDLCLSLLYS